MKKGFELSINFLVTIIIAVTIFAFGVMFIYDLAGKADELKSLTVNDLDNRIGQLLCEGTQRVCIGVDRQVIKRGDFAVFGIKIINVQDEADFTVDVTRPSPSGYTKEKAEIFADALKWKPRTRTISLGRNEEKEIGIGIEVPRNAKQGTYIFDVSISPYSEIHKFYVEVP